MNKEYWIGKFKNEEKDDRRHIELSIGVIPAFTIIGLLIWWLKK
ncbi:hypothetical protein ACEE19_00630 [Aerococcus suis]